nr:hypothetical protein [uncultured bacterium]
MRDHRKLRVFELADKSVLEVYRETKTFPRDEMFGLISRLPRASVSTPSNVVDGCARQSQADFVRFLDVGVRFRSRNRISALLASGRGTFPLTPVTEEIEGHSANPKITDLPIVPESLSIITPPEVTRQVVADAIAAGVKHIWMQPGAEDEQASESAREADINVIDDGSCILVLLARHS